MNLRAALPRSLTARLVVTAVALVAVVSVLLALVTTLVMRGYLTSRLDDQVQGVAQRALHGRGGPGDGGPGGGGAYSPDTLLVDSDTGRGGISGDYGGRQSLSSANLARLRAVPQDGDAHTVDLQGIGDYRVITVSANVVNDNGSTSRDKVAFGLPTQEIGRTTHSLLLWSLLLALGGTALAGLLGALVVRRQLRPLRQVATTAYDVTAMPLETGGQTIETRVPADLTDDRTEAGQVGLALNTLLDHVDAALGARHRSEQQVRQFVADASHELRTPLSTIHGYAELSRRTPDDPVALSAALDKVETEATRMTSLVSDMLLLARLDSGRPLDHDDVDLTLLVLEAVNDARVVGGEHTWQVDLPEEPVTVNGDAQRLHQVVTNLLNNARRHTPPGTTVTVSLTSRPAPQDPVVLTVSDDGPGMSADLVEHAFERFTRGDSSRTRESGGAGLGLSLVQAITEAHGGTAAVTSRPGKTVFTLSLP